MLRFIATVLIFTLFHNGHFVFAGSEQNVRKILEKAIKANGCEKTVKVKGFAWKVKGSMTMFGKNQKYKANYYFAKPDKLRFDLKMNIQGQKVTMSAASNGQSAWEKMGPMIRKMDKKKAEEFDHMTYTMYLTDLVPLRNKNLYKLTPLGESKFGKEIAVGIKVSRKGKKDVRLFFDKKSFLLKGTKTKVYDEFTEKIVDQETYFSGYKKKDGLMVFDTITIERDGKVFVIEEMSDFRPLKKIDTKKFAKPAS